MQGTEQLKMIESLSLILFLVGTALVVLAVLISIKAFGGWKNVNRHIGFLKIKKKMAKGEEQEEQGVHDVQDRHSYLKARQAYDPIPDVQKYCTEASETEEDSLTETMPLPESDDLSVTEPLTDRNLDETMPLNRQPLTKNGEPENVQPDTEDTAVLNTPVATNKFRIIKKLVITHEKEEEK